MTPATNRIHRIISKMFTLGRLGRGRFVSRHSLETVSPLQIHAMDIVNQSGKITMRQLAEAFRIAPASATALAERMERQGYIKRVRDARDRRMVFLELTRIGARTLGRCQRMAGLAMAEVMSHLSVASQERLIGILEELERAYRASSRIAKRK